MASVATTSLNLSHKPPFFNDVHSALQNILGELSKRREEIENYETWHQQSCDQLRKELEQERFEGRESMNKFRYEFDELVHKRVETVLEGLEEMEQNQKFKDRQQQHQLDSLEDDLKTLKGNIGGVNSQWRRFSTNAQRRTRLTQPKRASMVEARTPRNKLGDEMDKLKKDAEANHLYTTAELMRIRLKSAAEFLGGTNWERTVRQVDTDGSGQIGFSEFRKLCRDELRVMEPDSQLRVLFDSLDADNSGEIGVEELLEYVTDPAQRMKSRLQFAALHRGNDLGRLLRELDKDKSGQISYPEFRTLCREKLKLLDKDVQLQAVFRSVDADNSGEISIREFSAYLNAVS